MLSFLLLLVIFSLARTRLLVLEDFGQLEKPLLGLVNEQFELEVVSIKYLLVIVNLSFFVYIQNIELLNKSL